MFCAGCSSCFLAGVLGLPNSGAACGVAVVAGGAFPAGTVGFRPEVGAWGEEDEMHLEGGITAHAHEL